MEPGTADFATLLRHLKERSKLSYGALAQRLHVSTSTLHRYVNGDAIPTEFGTVERFARLTGASAEETVELHRQWIAADVGRRGRQQAPPERQGTQPEPEPTPPPTTEPAAEQEPSSLTAVPPHGPAKRRWALLAAALAALTVSTTAIILGTMVGHGRSSAAGPTSPTSQAAQTSQTAPTTPSSSPSPSAAPSPLTVNIRPYTWEDRCLQWYLLNRPPTEVPPPPAEEDARGWATALKAVPGGNMKIELSVQGTSGQVVVLNALHVRTVSKAAPLPWSAFSMGQGCGSGITPSSFDVDLDASRPLTKPTPGTQGDTVVPAIDFPFRVSATDPQVLDVEAHTAAANVSWYLELEWSSGDRQGALRIDNHGRPFQTSALKGRPMFDYNADQNIWSPDLTSNGG